MYSVGLARLFAFEFGYRLSYSDPGRAAMMVALIEQRICPLTRDENRFRPVPFQQDARCTPNVGFVSERRSSFVLSRQGQSRPVQ